MSLDRESRYKCEARNRLGVATTWMELFVESKHHVIGGEQIMNLIGGEPMAAEALALCNGKNIKSLLELDYHRVPISDNEGCSSVAMCA